MSLTKITLSIFYKKESNQQYQKYKNILDELK